MLRYFMSNRAGWSACAALALLLPACQGDGHICLFGYTTRPNMREGIHTVRVKVFENKTYYQRLEFQLTQAVINAIEAVPGGYKVVNGDGPADTELTGTIVSFNKGVLNINNVNEQRDLETTLTVQIVWRDLRTGEILSRPPRRPGEPIVEPPVGVVPPVAVVPPVVEAPPGTRSPTVIATPTQPTPPTIVPNLTNSLTLAATAHYVPEVGQSMATGQQACIQKMARDIVEVMEKPW
jgi:hypothetical protein